MSRTRDSVGTTVAATVIESRLTEKNLGVVFFDRRVRAYFEELVPYVARLGQSWDEGHYPWRDGRPDVDRYTEDARSFFYGMRHAEFVDVSLPPNGVEVRYRVEGSRAIYGVRLDGDVARLMYYPAE